MKYCPPLSGNRRPDRPLAAVTVVRRLLERAAGQEGAVALPPGRFVRKTILPAGVPGHHRARTDGAPRTNAPRRASACATAAVGEAPRPRITCSGSSSLGG